MPTHKTPAQPDTRQPRQARLRIGIVGGGIGGVALAVALSRRSDLEVHLFEAAERFSEIGAGVSFGPNAVRAISLLGLEAAYRRIADASPAPCEDVWFEWRRGRDEAYLTASLAPGCGQSSVHRADFLDAIVAHLPAGIAHFGKRCQAVVQDAEGISVSFADGSEFRGDLLIGFDGIKSAVREHVLPVADFGEVGPRWSGTQAYRGLVPVERLRRALQEAGCDERLAVVPQMYLGTDRHILTFPVKQAALINVVAFVTDRSCPEPQLPEGAPWVVEVSQQAMLEDFPGWGAASKAILGCIDQPTRWALHELPELPRYARDRVLIVGDAAHAMLPHQGAGAGQALEDAYVLAGLLSDPHAERNNVAAVLAAFEAARHARTRRVQATSREAGDVYECRGDGIGADEARLAADLERRFDWLWQHDPRDDVALARRRLKWPTPAVAVAGDTELPTT
ncbi:salicylate 1-monooxygenase [Halomonas organivorans]|uniref:Salicylate hydroxylase n=1 Tax=Halomonas organivorans TaxID=257772 RepID=A0A7W5BXS0_9GAMM|nr:salicylate 1-monooxygenase [Halomonas organivorans]MBB3141030.1 salicylate hydroxylase [Halomonas organivorans]